jgi:hypothetical protein
MPCKKWVSSGLRHDDDPYLPLCFFNGLSIKKTFACLSKIIFILLGKNLALMKIKFQVEDTMKLGHVNLAIKK